VFATTEDQEDSATGAQDSGDLGDGGLRPRPEVEAVDREHRVQGVVMDRERDTVPSVKSQIAGPGIWPSTFEADHVPGQATMPVTEGQSLLLGDLHHGLWGMDEGPEVVAPHPAQQVVPADHEPGDRIGRRV
jgi:hypothetical protein